MIGAMIVLLLLTLLAVSSMSSSTLQERMTLNSYQYANGLSATESGLSDGETAISSPTLTAPNGPPPPGPDAAATCATPPCTCQTSTPICFVWNTDPWDRTAGVVGADHFKNDRTDDGNGANWWTNHAIAFSTTITGPVAPLGASDGRSVPAVAAQPSYIIEYLGQKAVPRTLQNSDPTVTFENFYQITSRGVARSDASDVDSRVVQSVYGRIF